ncbi:MAG: Mycothiol acetyltransferase [Chroococcopsis gigantea SAG 12.99]|jgi:ribosomal-protein-alanine N-acetyltransferase|nr:Mycothiol acetyltransferase [Chroococcopsis gigantea SAG 12.99]
MKNLHLITPDTNDIEALVELDHRCLGGIWTLEGYKREIDCPNSNFLILMTDQRLLGYGCYWAILEEAHITLLAVDPDYQGQGLGQLLLYELLKGAAAGKLERATLEVGVANSKAIELYEKFGFKTVGRRKKYYPATGEDALILWRTDLQTKQFAETLHEWDNMIEHRISENNWQLVPLVNKF